VAEHVERDKTRPCVIALVAEDAIEFERVADRLVNLEHHLVWHEQHRHRSGGAVRRSHELQRFIRQSLAATYKPGTLDIVDASLSGVGESSRLRVGADVCRHARMGHDGAEILPDLAAGIGEIGLFERAQCESGIALHDP
jgi:hypothetical protein